MPVLGVIASSGGGGSTPSWLPDGAILFINFLDTSQCYASGAVQDIDDVLVENANNGPYDPLVNLTVHGLTPSSQFGGAAFACYPVLASAISAALIASGGTWIAGLNIPVDSTGSGSPPLCELLLFRDADFEAYCDANAQQPTGPGNVSLEWYNDPDSSDPTGNLGLVVGGNKMGMTINADFTQAGATNGGAVLTLTGFTPSPTVDVAGIQLTSGAVAEGELGSAPCYMTSLTIYPAMSNAAMQALTA